MQLNLFDGHSSTNLLPFTHTRPVADIFCGIWSMRQRWEIYLNTEKSGSITDEDLVAVFPPQYKEDNIFVNGAIFANVPLAIVISNLKNNQALFQGETLIALRSEKQLNYSDINTESLNAFEPILFQESMVQLNQVWDIFMHNDYAIRSDFEFLTDNKTSEKLDSQTRLIGSSEKLFIAKGAKVYAESLNTSTGPIYIDEDAEIMEGAMLRGPLYVGKHAVVKMGAKIYGATTISEGSKVGGEVSNVVFFDNSNKGHDGFVGNAVIGSWCNLGADTNCSNLKNNYDEVSIWSEKENKLIKTGLQFCGLLMGDHSKSGINTMFNTGTVVGVSANVYGADFPDKFIPSFSWGGKNDLTNYKFEKAVETAERMMGRRNKSLTEAEKALFKTISDKNQSLRNTF